MANSQRTYQWVNGRIVDVGSTGRKGRRPESAEAPVNAAQQRREQKLGIQNWLLLFTFSSVLMVFAGLALFAFCFILYALIFG